MATPPSYTILRRERGRCPRLALHVEWAGNPAQQARWPQVRWDADAEVLDTDGRTPLHWAAYKGFADCIRLLLFMDSDQMRQDREARGPTPPPPRLALAPSRAKLLLA